MQDNSDEIEKLAIKLAKRCFKILCVISLVCALPNLIMLVVNIYLYLGK
jgi:hypothetical protein